MKNIEQNFNNIWDEFDYFTDCIKKCDIQKVKYFLNNSNFNPTLSNFIAFEYASCCIDSNVFKLFFRFSGLTIHYGFVEGVLRSPRAVQ